MTGRPCKLDDIRRKKILDALKGGNTRLAAAKVAGIGASTFFGWLAAGRRGEEPFVELLDSVKRAEADSELALVKIIVSAADRQWTASAWMLERRHPRSWAKREIVQSKPLSREEALDELREILREDPSLVAELMQELGQKDTGT